MTSISDVIGHYQRSIEKSAHDEARLLHCIEKLYKLPITVEHLQQTGIGKTVNSLRKYEKEVGIAAKALVAKWKAMVAAEEELVSVDDTQKINGNDRSNSDNENYNGSQYSQESENGNHHSSNHKYKQSSSRNEKSSDVDRKDRKHKENGRDDSRHHSQHSTSDSKKINNVLSDRHNRDKPNSSSSSKHHREKHSSSENRHHSDRRKEDKVKSSSNHSSRKVPTPEPGNESPPIGSDDNLYENDYDDEDEEKLIIDTEHNKEKIEEIDQHSHRESSKTSKSSSRHKSSSNKRSSSEDNQPLEHESKKKSKHESKDRDKKESSKLSSSKSHSDEKRDKDKSNDRHHHKSSKKDEEKSSERRNGEHKSSSSSSTSKSKSSDKSKEVDKHKSKSDSPKNSKDKSRSKESSSSSSKKSSKRKHESADDSESADEQSPKKAKSSRQEDDDGIDNTMGNLSFEEALGMIAPPSKSVSSKLKSPKGSGVSSKTPSSATSSRSVASSSNSSRSKTPPLLTTKIKLEPLDPKLSLELPIISPNYKPLPLNPTVMDCVFANNPAAKPTVPARRLMTDDEALQSGISSKTIRTKIYSGMKTGAMLQVPTLFKLCIRVLQKNIDALEYTGGVPYEVLKPVLELASPEQLQTFEEFNPYLLEDTDDLWRVHVNRRYKSQKRREMETWRDMYARCKEQQEERLNLLTKNITFQQKQITAPIKRTQLAYVDVDVKPPRNVQRKQEQYGTKGKAVATPAARVEALKQITPSAAKIGDTRLRVAADVRDHAPASSHVRPKKAPLMQKTLQFMKGRFKR